MFQDILEKLGEQKIYAFDEAQVKDYPDLMEELKSALSKVRQQTEEEAKRDERKRIIKLVKGNWNLHLDLGGNPIISGDELIKLISISS